MSEVTNIGAVGDTWYVQVDTPEARILFIFASCEEADAFIKAARPAWIIDGC